MAAKYPMAEPHGLKKVMKPVISTDVMGNRNVEVKAVGAWAEPATFFSQIRVPDAVWAAQREEEKIAVMQKQKEQRLRQFQQDVKKRVRHMNKVKRKQQLEKDFELMEKEHKLVQRSLKSSEHMVGQKDHVMQQVTPSVSIKQSSAAGLQDEPFEGGRNRKVFNEHNEQVHTFTSQARQKLSSRRLEDVPDCDSDSDMLPGGRWEKADQSPPWARPAWSELQINDISEDKEELEKFRHDEEEEEIGCDKDEHVKGRCVRQRTGEDEEDGEEEEEVARLRSVQFDLPRGADDQQPATVRRVARKKAQSRRPTSAPDLRVGATEEAERKRRGQQMLNYRRLYSDLERQTVRENDRRKKQRSQIYKIKKEKEEWRKFEEDQARRLVEPRDPVTGETCVETNLREQLEQTHVREVIQEREEQRQKQREMIRYLDALRKNLREKLTKQGRELPPLCCCGETLWDTHPDTCANNCFFYKNHRAYARALQSMLTSSEVM